MTNDNSDLESHTLVDRIRDQLDGLRGSIPDDPKRLREEVKRLVEIRTSLGRLSKRRLGKLSARDAGRERVLAYLKLFTGVVISGAELQIVGGIQATARRIRELRVQLGYSIATGNSRDDLRRNEYVLESPVPDAEEAEKWRIVNRIRRRKDLSVRDRWLELLKANVGKPVTLEQLAYVNPKGSDKRRLRELRTQEGYRVVTRQSGRPDLPANVYLLESLDPLPAHDRKIDDETYEGILRRDRGRCRKCAWCPSEFVAGSKRRFLEVHHIEHYRDGGTSNTENLVTLCNLHHDAVHRLDIGPDRFWDWLADVNAEPSQA